MCPEGCRLLRWCRPVISISPSIQPRTLKCGKRDRKRSHYGHEHLLRANRGRWTLSADIPDKFPYIDLHGRPLTCTGSGEGRSDRRLRRRTADPPVAAQNCIQNSRSTHRSVSHCLRKFVSRAIQPTVSLPHSCARLAYSPISQMWRTITNRWAASKSSGVIGRTAR